MKYHKLVENVISLQLVRDILADNSLDEQSWGSDTFRS
jgi:hypothetical protein